MTHRLEITQSAKDDMAEGLQERKRELQDAKSCIDVLQTEVQRLKATHSAAEDEWRSRQQRMETDLSSVGARRRELEVRQLRWM